MTDRPLDRRAVDEKTPASRNPIVDLLRAATIVVVAIGHCTLVAVALIALGPVATGMFTRGPFRVDQRPV